MNQRIKPIVYITFRDLNILVRPLLAQMGLGTMLIYSRRDIINYFRMWKLVAGLDKIRYPWFKYHVWRFIGMMISLFLLKLRCDKVIILNPIGVFEAKMFNNSAKVILDYMDVLLDESGRLPGYHVRALNSADGIIFWSKAILSLITSNYRIKKFTYIPYGVNLKVFNPQNVNPGWFRKLYGLKSKFIITYSGGVWRDSPMGRDLHGVDKLPWIFAEIHKKLEYKVAFVLNCPYDHKLFRELKRLHILHKVIWIKPMRFNDPLRLGLFSSSDILVLPSSRFPAVYYAERMKIFEYMASGKAIIAEGTPGVTSVLNHLNNAYLVPLDDIQGMVDGIIELFHNIELRRELGRMAYRDVRSKYDWKILARRYRNFITEVVGE